MFDELKAAILNTIANPTDENLETLKKVYNLFFVEPENDKDFQDWRNEEDE